MRSTTPPGHSAAESPRALEQGDVEDALYVAALSNRLVHDAGERQTWATIRSGLSEGLQELIDLDEHTPSPRRLSS